MLDNNNHLVEVMCGMRFDAKKNDWDSTYFGRFHEKILVLGYREKEERKEVQFQFQFQPLPSHSEIRESATKMIFKNSSNNTAIMLGSHYISFHKLFPYNNWIFLIEEVVKPGLKVYKDLGLGTGIEEVQCLYLNKFLLIEGQKGHDFFTFLPAIDDTIEDSISFQGRYNLPGNKSIQLTLNGNAGTQRQNNELFLECSCFAKTTQNEDCFQLAQKAHDEANSVFKKIFKI